MTRSQAIAARSLVVLAAIATAGAAAPVKILFPGSPDDFEGLEFRLELEAFASANGLEVQVIGDDGRPPEEQGADIVILTQSQLGGLAARKLIVPLDYLDADVLRSDYGNSVVQRGSHGGRIYGVPTRGAYKSLLWTKKDQLQLHGYEAPRTFSELLRLSDSIKARHHQKPWCMPLASGGADYDGWPGTDWIEDLVLQTHGPAVYDGWVRGEIPFTDRRIVQAFRAFGKVALHPHYPGGAIATDGSAIPGRDASVGFPYFTIAGLMGMGAIPEWYRDPSVGFPIFDGVATIERCWMMKQASFVRGFAAYHGFEDPDGELTAVKFPGSEVADSPGAIIAADLTVALTDLPATRAVMRFLASPEFGTARLYAIDWTMPNLRFDRSRYASRLVREQAGLYAAAVASGTARFDGSDDMPEAVWKAFNRGIISYVAGGEDELPGVLSGIDAARKAP